MVHHAAPTAEPSLHPLPAQWWVTLGALLGYLHWFFGNLYEAVVFSPNWVLNSPAQMERLHGFFVATSPTL